MIKGIVYACNGATFVGHVTNFSQNFIFGRSVTTLNISPHFVYMHQMIDNFVKFSYILVTNAKLKFYLGKWLFLYQRLRLKSLVR